jgi:hypothetical protein
MTFDLGSLLPTDTDEYRENVRKATRCIQRLATDADDARGLLDALGLGGGA